MKQTKLRTGFLITYLAITVNLIIAGLLLMTMINSLNYLIDFLSNMSLNLGVGILALYISGFFIGNKIEYLIFCKKWKAVLTGIFGLFLVLLIGISVGSTVGFLQEGIEEIGSAYGLKNALFDYYIKPFYWILLLGVIPTTIIGGLMAL